MSERAEWGAPGTRRLTDGRRPTDLLSIGAVAKLRGCSRNTVHQAITRGDLEAVPIYGAEGEVVSFGIQRSRAEGWQPRDVGRPRKAIAPKRRKPVPSRGRKGSGAGGMARSARR